MFLRNERGLGVKNGTLGTIEHIDRAGMAVRTDDGRSVVFDHKDYADVTHGYAATIHKSQGVTVDRAHVLATPGLDAHASYVALSRHRHSVQLHYGRDDFVDAGRLARTLSRERPKDNILDYDAARDRFAERRGFERSAILDTLARERLVDPSHSAPAPERPRSIFDGLRLGPVEAPKQNPAPKRDVFAGIKRDPASAPAVEEERTATLGRAVQRYARAAQDIDRMTARQLSPLEYQKKARDTVAQALDQMRPYASRDIDMAFAREPGLIGEAANGRTANAIRAMQLEAEVRTNPELRADRFVQAWQQMRRMHDKLSGWENEEQREGLESRMRAMIKGLGVDANLGAALARRGEQLGLGKQWSLEWSPGSRDGGIGHELTNTARTRAVMIGLTESLGRNKDLGISL
jgi:hypothetical protein